ncbi:hypothetical protein ABTM32_23160, partial [Acinetobacter baumannii]
ALVPPVLQGSGAAPVGLPDLDRFALRDGTTAGYLHTAYQAFGGALGNQGVLTLSAMDQYAGALSRYRAVQPKQTTANSFEA